MIDLRRILVPTDFSKYSHNALTYATAFAEKFGAELYLLHVVQDLALYVPDALALATPVSPPMDQFTSAARTALDRLIAENKLERFPTHPAVREGTAFYEIIRFAREKDVDL